ncbi:ABC transporter ATP-binding protein [Phreatobacter oligotrophus]|jgi:putative spermidine/putrescine transport system ATP-binding protein|uniref:ABC transporter ATP-binding protein n=1 Tax=Phreatobacter oligotrophus TaxID=1122261 RepID=UPI002353F9F5|nr:ABC transporter ATP-binding protein [Phreatobacter oligotrophus]MBX9989479.1 ABC transporter ATP-binding protein [Phreatobacter oligotrophus]
MAVHPTPAVPAAQPLTLDGVTHSYGAGLAVDNVTLEVKGGELVALLGPSGCGKTTLLRIVAGFIQQTNGKVVIGDRPIDELPPNRREIGIVFQNYALFPHITVAENIAYGLAARGESRAVQAERVKEMLATVRMEGFAERKPRQLSGGQQQRVALARALAIRPRILLLDEPFAALDKNLRLDMQIEIKRLQRQFSLTAIMVTHDQDEAMSIADRIAVMSQGRIEQLGAPAEIYDDPATLFVNNFIGSSNLLKGAVEAVDGGEARIALACGATWTVPARGRFEPGAPVLVSVRPEQMMLADAAAPDRIPVDLKLSLPIGGALIHDVAAPGGEQLKIAVPRRPGMAASAPGTAHAALAPHARPALFPAA